MPLHSKWIKVCVLSTGGSAGKETDTRWKSPHYFLLPPFPSTYIDMRVFAPENQETVLLPLIQVGKQAQTE